MWRQDPPGHMLYAGLEPSSNAVAIRLLLYHSEYCSMPMLLCPLQWTYFATRFLCFRQLDQDVGQAQK